MVVTGTLLLFTAQANILFYSGSTHSFISYKYASLCKKKAEPLDSKLLVFSPSSDSLSACLVLKS